MRKLFKRLLKRSGEMNCIIAITPGDDGVARYTVRWDGGISAADALAVLDKMKWDLSSKIARKAYASGYKKGTPSGAFLKRTKLKDLA